jgi:hypothetical protein
LQERGSLGPLLLKGGVIQALDLLPTIGIHGAAAGL